jgi:hypothetical protein
MKVKILQIVCVVALFGVVWLPTANAGTGKQEMIVTIRKAPVEVPGHVLLPGKYEFRFTNDEHEVVSITTADGRHPIGFFTVVPITRPTRLDHAKIELSPAEPGSVARIRGFFYPGAKTGYKFLYANS